MVILKLIYKMESESDILLMIKDSIFPSISSNSNLQEILTKACV